MSQTMFYNNNITSDMNSYPYTLTPPSSNEDSPQMYHLNPSPQYIMMNPVSPGCSNAYNVGPQHMYYNINTDFNTERKQPCLVIVEQPTDKFRFRYKSEMAGTHGSLTGFTSDKTRKQTYPTVKLQNFEGRAVVRCSLYQHNNSSERQPHAHRLVKKQDNEEIDDPHRLIVTSAENYEACFHSMGIIHTAKKHLVDVLKMKKRQLKKEKVARDEKKFRELTTAEDVEIKREAEEESKAINLNIVCLRFDAFIETSDGILHPICEPIYSHAINNLKSALTGELKIVRLDHSSSPAKGLREIFMFVEKVTKKNIKIRFFELDAGENEIWEAYGKFNDLDVHHQYAIAFKTPPYRLPDITDSVRVYIELERPSDGSRSEPREFKYTPSPNYQAGMKRSRMAFESTSESYTSSGESFVRIPTTVQPPTPDIFEMNDIPMLGSAEFDQLFMEHGQNFNNSIVSLGSLDLPATDAPKEIRPTERESKRPESILSKEDLAITTKSYKEFISLLKAKSPNPELVPMMLKSIFSERVNNNGDNTLHLLTMDKDMKRVHYWLEVLRRKNLSQIINMPNNKGETIVHTAIAADDHNILKLILQYCPDLSLADGDGNTALHCAVMNNRSCVILDVLLRSKHLGLNIDAENNDDLTALQMSVKMNRLQYVTALCNFGCDVNAIDKRSGNSILHIAVAEQSEPIVRFLLHNTAIEVLKKNYQGITAIQLSKHLIQDGSNQERIKIYNLIEQFMVQRNLTIDCIIKEENDSDDEEMEMEIDIKTEKYTTEELQDKYKGIDNFTPDCLEQVASILDKTENWLSLANLLDLEHIANTENVRKSASPSKTFLQYAVNLGEVFHIRNFLEVLEEYDAVAIIDKMVFTAKMDM